MLERLTEGLHAATSCTDDVADGIETVAGAAGLSDAELAELNHSADGLPSWQRRCTRGYTDLARR